MSSDPFVAICIVSITAKPDRSETRELIATQAYDREDHTCLLPHGTVGYHSKPSTLPVPFWRESAAKVSVNNSSSMPCTTMAYRSTARLTATRVCFCRRRQGATTDPLASSRPCGAPSNTRTVSRHMVPIQSYHCYIIHRQADITISDGHPPRTLAPDVPDEWRRLWAGISHPTKPTDNNYYVRRRPCIFPCTTVHWS